MPSIISIDPGQHNLGLAYSKYEDGKFVVVDYKTLYPSKYPDDIRKHRKYFTERLLTGRMVSNLLSKEILDYCPDFVCSEDAFYNPARPSAFVSLLIVLYVIENTLYKLYHENVIKKEQSAQLYKTPPTLVKKVFSETYGGKADKDDMYTSLKKRVREGDISFFGLRSKQCPPLQEFTEHSVDAIAVGYAFAKVWLPLLESKILDRRCTSFNKPVKQQLKKMKYKSPYLSL